MLRRRLKENIMGTYSNVLIKYENTYILKNYNAGTIIGCCFLAILTNIMLLGSIYLLINDIIESRIGSQDFSLLIGIIFYYFIYHVVDNNIKNIKINIKDSEIIFKYKLFPLYKIRKIKFNNIKEISINYTPDDYLTVPYKFQTKIKEQIYNIDIIDYEQNAYRIYRSTAYNNEFKNFAENFGKIINKEINDQNNVIGDKNIYKKIIL
jgi:hypothetical protein